MKKAERREWISSKARALAASGKFRDYREIEFELDNVQGWSIAHSVLDSAVFRQELNQTCARAYKGETNA